MNRLVDAPPTHALLAPRELADGFFIENRGQVAGEVRFYTPGNPAVGFRDDSVMFVVRGGDGIAAYMVRFVGANAVAPVGRRDLPLRTNFFLGNDPARWRTDVPTYEEIVYPNLYDGIDLIYHSAHAGVKYEFLVHPGGDPREIRLQYDGVSSMAIEGGGLVVRTVAGAVSDSPPYSYDAAGNEVRCPLVERAPATVGFACDEWDRTREMTIDPVTLLYSTHLGGTLEDVGYGLAVDSAGAAYVAGSTQSTDFPATPGVYGPSFLGMQDAFVAKVAPDGRTLLYATYLGGSAYEWAYPIAVDASGNAVVSGATTSTDFPISPGAFQTALVGGQDAFVTKLGAAGDALVYSTYLGGSSSSDSGWGIAVDTAGAAIVAGQTQSADFPTTPGAWEPTPRGSPDGFVTKFAADGAIVWSTYLGGGGNDIAETVATDRFGNVYVSGETTSANFTVTPGAFDISYNGGPGDAFVVKLTSGGSPVYSTYLGGIWLDDARGITVDRWGNAYVGGMTTGPGFPTTPGAFDTTFNGGTIFDLFVTKLNASGTGLVYSTYLGGSGDEFGAWMAVDSMGFAHVAASTTSGNYPVTANAYDATANGSYDVVVTILNATGASLAYSSYLGGSGEDDIRGVGLGPFGETYVAGPTRSTDFPTTPGAFDTTMDPGDPGDAFVTKMGTPPSPGPPDLLVPPSGLSFDPPGPVDAGTSVTIHALIQNGGGSDAINVGVRFHDGPPAPSNQIDVDQRIPFITYPSGQGVASVPWTAGPAGSHVICAVADPDNRIAELDETNNVGCAPIDVVAVPMADLMPVQPQPASQVRTGLATSLPLSVAVQNVGNATAPPFWVSFRNESGAPFVEFPASALASGTMSAPFTAVWTAPATPGTYRVLFDADSRGEVPESNETNNAYAWTIEVVPGPATDLVVGAPNVTASETYVTSATTLGFTVLDQSGTGIRNTTYRVDVGPWINYTATGPFTLGQEGSHRVEWSTEDFAGNVEPTRSATLVVDNTPPTTAVSIGDPKYLIGGMHITSATPLTFQAADGGIIPVGVGPTEYRLDAGSWRPYAAPFAVPGDGTHVLEYRSTDRLGNEEIPKAATLFVDDFPPAVTVDVGSPKYSATDVFVTSATPISLTAVDRGSSPSGLASIEYRIEGGAWTPYGSAFALSGADGTRTIGYRAADYVGNAATGNVTLVLDDSPPETTIVPSTGAFTADTVFTLAATDNGSGVAATEFRIDSGPWTPYGDGFTLDPGDHTIVFRSADRLGNREPERTRAIHVEGSPPSSAANLKPLVAAVFATILVVVGVWSARRAPWPFGNRRRMRAFAFAVLPFVVAEAATGIVSFLTGLLSIPPVLGVGTALDLTILVAGIWVSTSRVRKGKPPT